MFIDDTVINEHQSNLNWLATWFFLIFVQVDTEDFHIQKGSGSEAVSMP